jgi:non-heme chloroperoxidase
MPSKGVWESIIAGFRKSRADYTHTALPGALAPEGVQLSDAVLQRNEYIVGEADALALERCIHIITSVDFTGLLTRLGSETDLPAICLHGDSDKGAPYEATAKVVQQLIPRVETKLYQGAAHCQ